MKARCAQKQALAFIPLRPVAQFFVRIPHEQKPRMGQLHALWQPCGATCVHLHDHIISREININSAFVSLGQHRVKINVASLPCAHHDNRRIQAAIGQCGFQKRAKLGLNHQNFWGSIVDQGAQLGRGKAPVYIHINPAHFGRSEK